MTNLRHSIPPAGARMSGLSSLSQNAVRAPAANTQLRTVQFSWLSRLGEVQRRTTSIPDMPLFHMAFNAFARGALLQTPQGPVAVEDLLPGMMVEAIDGAPTRINWVGSMASSNVGEAGQTGFLYRVTEGSYGLGQGKPDLLLGPGARLMRPGQLGRDTARLQSMTDIADGQQIVQVAPRASVQLYHIALPSHRLIRVNDVAVESFHPGHAANLAIAEDLFGQFASLFPHVRTLAEFGPLNYLR
ncbi:MAG: Hint domain-containing protein [Paracoccaceae bacterium]